MCRGDKLGHREGTPQPSCLRRPGPALGPCHPLHPATGTGDALWRTVRVHGPCLHAEHNMGLQGAGAEAGWKPILDAVGLQTGCCRPSKETHSPWTPVTRQGSWASALPFWLETGPAQTPLVMQRKASRGQHVAPGPTHVREGHKRRHSVDCERRKTAVFLKPLCYFLSFV